MRKTRRLVVVAILAALGLWLAIATQMEQARIAPALPKAASADVRGAPGSAPASVDATQLLDDVRTLASPAFCGRRTGTEGSRRAQAYLQGRFAALGLEPFGAGYAQPFAFTHHSLKGLLLPGRPYSTAYPSATNLVGRLPGREVPGRVIVVSAHYDHLGIKDGRLYPGADDNASGVAAMLAIARWFKAHPPRHTIVFAAFDAEELGLRGAKQFVSALPFDRSMLAANLNLDMVGHNDNNELFIAGTRQSPQLRPMVVQAAARGTVDVRLGHDRPLWLAGGVEDWTGSSDHGAFHDAGVPFLYAGVADHPDYHAPGDTFEHINQPFFLRTTALLVDLAARLDRGLDVGVTQVRSADGAR